MIRHLRISHIEIISLLVAIDLCYPLTLFGYSLLVIRVTSNPGEIGFTFHRARD